MHIASHVAVRSVVPVQSLLRCFAAELGWLRDVPWGFRKLLKYLSQRYQKPIYVTENVS